MNIVTGESLSFNLYREIYIYIVPGIWFVSATTFVLILLGVNIPLEFLQYVSGKQDENLNLIYLLTLLFIFIILCLAIGHGLYGVSVKLFSIIMRMNLPCITSLKLKQSAIIDIIKTDKRLSFLVTRLESYGIHLNQIPAYLILDQIELIRNHLLHLKYLDRYGTLSAMNRSLATSSILIFMINVVTGIASNISFESYWIYMGVAFAIFSLIFSYRYIKLEEEFVDRVILSFLVLDIIAEFDIKLEDNASFKNN